MRASDEISRGTLPQGSAAVLIQASATPSEHRRPRLLRTAAQEGRGRHLPPRITAEVGPVASEFWFAEAVSRDAVQRRGEPRGTRQRLVRPR
jgi:hypothetical protein